MGLLDRFKLKQPPPTPEALTPLPEQTVRGGAITQSLPEEVRLEMCAAIARFEHPKDILSMLRSQYQVDLSLATVYHYRNSVKWKPLIESYRQRYVSDVTSIPLFHQRVRLQRLESLWDKATALPETKADEARKKREELRAILKEARDETQKAVTHNTNLLIAQFGTMDDQQLIQVRDKLLNRLTKIKVPDAQNQADSGRGVPAEQVAQEVIDA